MDVVQIPPVNQHEESTLGGLRLLMESLLEIRNLSIRYRDDAENTIYAVDDASFQIAAGEIVGLLGESGSGKSTLASSLLGMFPLNATVESGAVLLQGTNLLKLGSKELRQTR